MVQLLDNNKYTVSINNWQVAVPVSACIPSLSVVSWQQSVLPAILDRDIVTSYFSATNPQYAAKPLNETILSTATGSFVAAGVNRWASLYVINPSAYAEMNDIPNYYYFATAKKLQDVAGQYFFDYAIVSDDLIGMSEETFKSLVNSKVATDPKVISIILTNAFGYTDLQVEEITLDGRKQLCADYLWSNLSTLQGYVNSNYATWNTTTYTVNSSVSADNLPITQ
jgi:hypothetical protein